MKKFRIFLLLIVATSIQLSVLAQNKETREVRDFDEIQMRLGGKVYVKQGNENEVILEGDEDYLEDIETEVRSGRLIIKDRRERSWKFWGNGSDRLTVYVTIKEFKGAYVSGSGDIIGQSKFATDDFTASISGSGDIELEVEADYVSSRISGSGNIEFRGKSNKAKLSISGSGKYFAEKMLVGDYNISMSGSGRGSVNVEGELDVRISGSGKVYYMGKPTGVNSSVAGSGTVRKIN